MADCNIMAGRAFLTDGLTISKRCIIAESDVMPEGLTTDDVGIFKKISLVGANQCHALNEPIYHRWNCSRIGHMSRYSLGNRWKMPFFLYYFGRIKGASAFFCACACID